MLRIIAIFILIYLIFRVVTIYIMPWLLKKFLERQKKKFYGEHYTGNTKGSQKQKTKGGTRTDDPGKKSKQLSSDDLGEYVDYEEIKDQDTSKKKK